MILSCTGIILIITGISSGFSAGDTIYGNDFSKVENGGRNANECKVIQPFQDDSGELKIEKSDLLGKVNAEEDPHFVTAARKYGGDGKILLRSAVYDDFIAMYNAAIADGVKLSIISGFRSFDHQVLIWEGKWNGRRQNWRHYSQIISEEDRAREILRYSAMPGTSRHHWGTDIDLNSLSPSYFRSKEGIRVYQWLAEHAGSFGFCQPYTAVNDLRPTGHNEEPWHWSYFPISSQFQKQYSKVIGYEDITGFDGAYLAASLRVIEDYVGGIDSRCKE